MGDDLADELYQEPVGRLVRWLFEPGEKFLVGGGLVGGPQESMDQLMVTRISVDKSSGVSVRRPRLAWEKAFGFLTRVELHVRPPSLSKQSPAARALGCRHRIGIPVDYGIEAGTSSSRFARE